MRLEAIITTVDALFAATQLARHPETRKQVALADRLVLTKTDLAAPDAVRRLRAVLAGLNPAAPILAAVQGDVDTAALFPPRFLDRAAAAPDDTPRRTGLIAEAADTGLAADAADIGLAAEAADAGHLGRYASVSLLAEAPLDWRAFEAWLHRIRIGHAEALLRVKGLLNIAGAAGPVVVQGVHHVVNQPMMLDAWPSADRRSRLVLIADRATIVSARESWADALPGILAQP
jgi:G3E family GTPase